MKVAILVVLAFALFSASAQQEVPTSGPPLRYPVLATQAGIQGAVVLDLQVEKGRAVNSVVLWEASGLLTAAAEKAIKSWTFPVDGQIRVTFVFVLKGAARRSNVRQEKLTYGDRNRVVIVESEMPPVNPVESN